jgi:hypothetical protein
VSDARRASVVDPAAVADYKTILQTVLYNRPSGTRQRLAEALGNKASFISQIANPAYSVPIPTRHVETILEVCHFSPAERTRFLEAYARAHPRSSPAIKRGARWRELRLLVPDLASAEKNKALDELFAELALSVARLLKDDHPFPARVTKGFTDEKIHE